MEVDSLSVEFEKLHLPKDFQIQIIDKDNNCKACEGKAQEYSDPNDLKVQSTKEVLFKSKIEAKLMIGRGNEVEEVQNEDFILQRGFLERKTSNFFTTFEKRYCVLTKKQLFCFLDETRQILKSCINFKLLAGSVRQQDNTFQLYFCPNHDPAVFEAKTSDETFRWTAKIREVISFQSQSDKIFIKPEVSDVYCGKNIISEDDFMRSVETCDIILMKTAEDTGCTFQRIVTHSEYDHVAILMKFQHQEVQIFQSNATQGVHIYGWKEYHLRFTNYEQIAYRKLYCQKKVQLQPILNQFVKETVGGKYGLGALKLMKMTSQGKSSDMKEKRNYFCSELVARAYKDMGLIERGRGSARYWPMDFTQRGALALLDNAYFGHERVIVLDRHTNHFEK